jgi:hypothetical protein
MAEVSGKYIKSQVEGAEMDEKALDKYESEKLDSGELESGNPEKTARTGKMLVTGKSY